LSLQQLRHLKKVKIKKELGGKKMADISNRTLALLLISAIVVSLGITIYSLNMLTTGKITGRATTQPGNVTVTIQDATSIWLYKSIVDFGVGYVNTSKAACATNATLNASYQYRDSEGSDCWTDNTKSPTGMAVENDGNRNVTLQIEGPPPATFFQGAGAPVANISWKARNNESNSCNTGLQSTYISFDGTLQTACSKLLFTPSNQDDIAIDIQVIVPAGLAPAVYTNSTIELTAAAAP
jgi:hypothetical protein